MHPLFDGPQHTVTQLYSGLQNLSIRNNLSQNARKELRALFEHYLPKPNNVLVSRLIIRLQTRTMFGYDNVIFLSVDSRRSVALIVTRESNYIKESWVKHCFFGYPEYLFKPKEVQLFLNLDGVPVFKSRKLSICPFWLQCINSRHELR